MKLASKTFLKVSGLSEGLFIAKGIWLGVHFDEDGLITIYGVDSKECRKL